MHYANIATIAALVLAFMFGLVSAEGGRVSMCANYRKKGEFCYEKLIPPSGTCLSVSKDDPHKDSVNWVALDNVKCWLFKDLYCLGASSGTITKGGNILDLVDIAGVKVPSGYNMNTRSIVCEPL